jgi:hypothetical protein
MILVRSQAEGIHGNLWTTIQVWCDVLNYFKLNGSLRKCCGLRNANECACV